MKTLSKRAKLNQEKIEETKLYTPQEHNPKAKIFNKEYQTSIKIKKDKSIKKTSCVLVPELGPHWGGRGGTLEKRTFSPSDSREK